MLAAMEERRVQQAAPQPASSHVNEVWLLVATTRHVRSMHCWHS